MYGVIKLTALYNSYTSKYNHMISIVISTMEGSVLRIVVIGTGYVGLVAGACFADIGYDVCCIDNNLERLSVMMEGNSPFYEPGLDEIIKRSVIAGKLSFSNDLQQGINGSDICLIAVGTPPDEDGAADTTNIEAVAREIGSCMDCYKLIINKSTAPVGTVRRIGAVVQSELERRGVKIQFDIASNPEFLREGGAVNDFINPDRLVFGVDSDRAAAKLRELYAFIPDDRCIRVDIESAEMAKYAANAMLATRISFMNEMSAVCEKVGADVEKVKEIIGMDRRIGSTFLSAGCGFGGSCFPKDISALKDFASKAGCECRIVDAVQSVNDDQKKILFQKLVAHFGSKEALKDRKVAIWGLSFKPGTSDIREAPSLVLIEKLLSAGVSVHVHDPNAMDECRREFGEREGLHYHESQYSALDGADALMIVTEWDIYRTPDLSEVKSRMRTPLVLDGRNIYSPENMHKEGFVYNSIGRP